MDYGIKGIHGRKERKGSNKNSTHLQGSEQIELNCVSTPLLIKSWHLILSILFSGKRKEKVIDDKIFMAQSLTRMENYTHIVPRRSSS